jgi:hypothetical protein
MATFPAVLFQLRSLFSPLRPSIKSLYCVLLIRHALTHDLDLLAESPASYAEILRSRAFWGLTLASCFLQPLQYFYITWMPRYFDKYAGVVCVTIISSWRSVALIDNPNQGYPR